MISQNIKIWEFGDIEIFNNLYAVGWALILSYEGCSIFLQENNLKTSDSFVDVSKYHEFEILEYYQNRMIFSNHVLVESYGTYPISKQMPICLEFITDNLNINKFSNFDILRYHQNERWFLISFFIECLQIDQIIRQICTTQKKKWRKSKYHGDIEFEGILIFYDIFKVKRDFQLVPLQNVLESTTLLFQFIFRKQKSEMKVLNFLTMLQKTGKNGLIGQNAS